MSSTTGAGPLRPLVSLPLTVHPGERTRFHSALADLRRQIPGLRATLRVRSVPDTDLVRLEGQGETELTDLAERLRRDYRIDFDAGPLAVLCVETIRKPAEGEGKYIRQTGGGGNYGHVKIRLDPSDPGVTFQFRNEIRGGVVPKEYVDSIRQGIQEAAEGGVLAGWEVIDWKATLIDGSYHEVDSNETAFRIAGAMAFRDAAGKAERALMEPVMAVEIVSPVEPTDSIVRDLMGRRGHIEWIEGTDGFRLFHATVPMRTLLGMRPNSVHKPRIVPGAQWNFCATTRFRELMVRTQPASPSLGRKAPLRESAPPPPIPNRTGPDPPSSEDWRQRRHLALAFDPGKRPIPHLIFSIFQALQESPTEEPAQVALPLRRRGQHPPVRRLACLRAVRAIPAH